MWIRTDLRGRPEDRRPGNRAGRGAPPLPAEVHGLGASELGDVQGWAPTGHRRGARLLREVHRHVERAEAAVANPERGFLGRRSYEDRKRAREANTDARGRHLVEGGGQIRGAL